MKSSAYCWLLPLAWLAQASAIDVPAGDYENLAASVAGGDPAADFRLTGDATFGWLTDHLTGGLDLSRFNLTWDTGGGNERTCNAALSGTGNLLWLGGGASRETQEAPGWLGGSAPNTFTGTLTLRHGTLVLNKPAGVAACGGKEIIVGGPASRNQAVLRWGNRDQLPDDARIVLTGPYPAILRPGGFSETCGPLGVETDAEIDFTGGPCELHFADSHAIRWAPGSQLMIRGWNGNVAGGNAKRLVFGAGESALVPPQLAAIGFVNPDGKPPGLYRANLLPSGEVVPAAASVAPVNPPFPIDPAADAARRASYEIEGLKTLGSLARNPAMPKRLAFFGDSITWLANGEGNPPESANPINDFSDSRHYYDQLGRVLKRYGGPDVAIFNHGINGGGIREIEDGREHTGAATGKTYQASFAGSLDKERIDLAVIYIGVNDAWWRNTPPDDFAASLARLVKAAQERHCKVVIATPLSIGELPDGTNPQDAAVEAIAARVRTVAQQSGATLVDLRTAFLAWSRNRNRELKLDGSLVFRKEGLLTRDGVHPTDTGSTLIADLIADGIVRATGMAVADATVPATASPYDLVPTPKSVEPAEGEMILGPAGRIVCSQDVLGPLAAILAGEIETLAGVSMRPARLPARPGDIVLQLDPAMKDEAYAISIGQGAVVKAGNYNALATGTTTLLQLIRSTAGQASLPQLKITDRPDYAYRAVLLDLGRKYHTIGSIEQVVRLCRFYKIRYIQLHLSDDQLFMFPSTRFSKAGRSNNEFARFEPRSAPKIKPYTREELVALDQYAASHGVFLIPELDLPGHSGRLIADEAETFAYPGNGSTVNIASPKTLKAVEDLLNEVMDVFQSSPYIHLGADEVSLNGLQETAEYQAALKKDPTLKSPHDLYCKFIAFLDSVVAKRGRRSIVWEEAWNPAGPYPLPKDAIVMVWSQGRSPAKIAASGHPIINTTWTPLYLVRDNKKSPRFLFDWDPTLFGREGSEEFTQLDDPAPLLGSQLSSWENTEATEIQSMRERAAILAERCWNAEPAGGGYEDFHKRWQKTDGLLDRLVHPIELKTEGIFTTDEHTFRGSLMVTLTSRQPGATIRYTLDNSLPGASWQTYDQPLAIDRPVFLRAGLFDSQGKQQGDLVGAWFRPEGSAREAQ